jgi:hypothetical protein
MCLEEGTLLRRHEGHSCRQVPRLRDEWAGTRWIDESIVRSYCDSYHTAEAIGEQHPVQPGLP